MSEPTPRTTPAAGSGRGASPATVLIVSDLDDSHALAVQDRIDRIYAGRARALLLDTATLPLASTLSWHCSDDAIRADLACAPPLPTSIGRDTAERMLAQSGRGAIDVPFDSLRAIWFRRPRQVTPHPGIADPELRDFAAVSTRSLLRALFAQARTVNDPDLERRASNKIWQLSVARDCGLPIPRTLVTTDPEALRAFVTALARDGREVVYKDMLAGWKEGPFTKRLYPADLERLDELALCPTAFQERLAGGADLRVAIVGQAIFAAEWRPEGGVRPTVDIRLDGEARMWPTRLAPELIARLRRLQAALGLEMGVHDLKLDERLGPSFLEVNPCGQWLDLEVEAGHPVSDAVARLLVEGVEAAASADGPTYSDADLERLHERAERDGIARRREGAA